MMFIRKKKEFFVLLILGFFALPSSYSCKRTTLKKTESLITFQREFEPPYEFVEDQKTGLSFAKGQILISVIQDSQELLNRKVEDLKNIITARGWKIGGEVYLQGKNPGAILQILGDFDTAEKIWQFVEEIRASDPAFRAIPETKIFPSEIPIEPLFDSWGDVPDGNNWHFEYMNFPSAWNIQNKGEISVGVIDFGFDLHEDLPQNVEYESLGGREDLVEHGISVLGVLGAQGLNGRGIAGAVWRWGQNSKIIFRTTSGSLSTLVEDILYLVDKVKVILFAGGLVWNGGQNYDEILQYHREIFSLVFQYVKYYDVIFIQSAGNEGVDARLAGVGASVKDLFPGNIILVGSVGPQGRVSSFSNWGNLVDVYAPGESIFTLCNGNTYCLKSGTSYSASLVAGLVVLVRSLRPDLTAVDVKDSVLIGMRKREGRLVFDQEFLLDAYSTLLYAKGKTPSSLPEAETLPFIPQIDDSKGGFLEPKAVVCAVYDNTNADGDRAFNAPKCPADSEICSSCGLLSGRDNATGLVEPNQPNIISTCAGADTGGTNTGRIESIQVETLSESGFFRANAGHAVKIVVKAYCSAGNHYVDILTTVTANNTNPTWIYFGSARCDQNPGQETFYCNTVATTGWKTCVIRAVFPSLANGTSAAVRARYQNSNAAQSAVCFTGGTIRDHDDLVFKFQNLPSSFHSASYNSQLSAPLCFNNTGWCGTNGIARCRDTTVTSGENVPGFPVCGAGTPANPSEPNTPNTVYRSCADTNQDDTNVKDEEVRRVNIKSLAPSGKFEGGQGVEISALVFCFPGDDQILFHYASGVTTDTTQVNWRHIYTAYCEQGGAFRQPFIITTTLPQLDNAEGWHAIRTTVIYAPWVSTQTASCPGYSYRDADDLIFYVKAVPPSSLPVCASFDNTTSDGDPAYNTPKCPAGASQCSTCDLVKSRDNISTPETNTPNTLSTAPLCNDQATAGTYLQTESIERIEIKSYSGTFNPGSTVEVRVLVNCNNAYPTYFDDRLQVLYSSNADNPTWTTVVTNFAVCSGPGLVQVSKVIPLGNTPGRHVVRVMFQRGDFTSGQVCATGTAGDTDDLVFTVGVPQAPSNFKAEGVAPDTITLSWIDVAGETYYELRWTDTYNSNYSSWYPHPASPLPQNSTWYTDRPLLEGTYRCYALRACNANGCSAYVWDCATVPSLSANCGTYDPSWKVPVCPGGVNNCSTCDLVRSRDSLPSRSEQNTPNTWQNSCADQSGGDYFSTGNSIEKIILSTNNSSFQPGFPITVTVQVFCATAGTQIAVYYSSSTNPVNWVLMGSTTCSGSNQVENKIFSFTPSTGSLYLVRTVMGAVSTCSTATQFEADDIAFRVGGVPDVPSTFDVYFVDPNIARVVWSDVSSETYYKLVSASTPSGPFTEDTPHSPFPANTTYHDHAPLGSGQGICFKVAACNSIGCSAFTPVKCTSKPPVAPSNLRVEAITIGSNPTTFTVRFIDNSTNEDGFVIDRIGAGDSSWTRTEWWSNSTTKSGTGERSIVFTLQTERQFCFRVASFVQVPGGGSLSLSSWADGVTRCLVAPAVPQNFDVSFEDFGGGSVASVLSWQDTSSYETGFVVRKGGSQIAILGQNASSFSDSAVSEGVSYTYSVSSYYSGTNVFAYGKTQDLTVYGILRPTPLYVERETSVVKLQWVDRSNVESGYRVERSINGGVWNQIASVNNQIFIDSSISTNTNYCYRVRAYTSSGNYSAYSEEKCVSTYFDGTQVRLVGFGSGEISVISSSLSTGRIFVGTSTGYVYSVRLLDGQVVSSYNFGAPVSGICVKDYGRSATVIVVSGQNVFKADQSLNVQNTYSAGSDVFGCAVLDSVYVTTSGDVRRLSISSLSLLGSITATSISSGPILSSGKVYFSQYVLGGKKVCWTPYDLSSISCSSTFQISTSFLSSDNKGVYAGTTDGKIVFVTHSGGSYSADLTTPSENIVGVVSVYNRGAQKLLGVSTQSGRFYMVEVTQVPPDDSIFGIEILWWTNVGGSSLSPSLMQSDAVSVGNSLGDIYTYRITNGVQILANTNGTNIIRTSPVSLDGFLIYGEGPNLRFLAGGEPVPENSWSRVGGNNLSDNLYSEQRVIFGLKEKLRYYVSSGVEDYVSPAPVSAGGYIYFGFSSTTSTDWIFRANPSGSIVSSLSYNDPASWITSNISVGNVLGGTEVVIAVINRTSGQPGYIHVWDNNLSSLQFSYQLPATMKYVRGVVLSDIVGGDGGREELVFVSYFPSQQRSRFYILDPESANPVVCTRDFSEHIWSMPLVSGSNIVIGGGGASSSGNLYVLGTSCNIVKTISFSGHLKEGYFIDVNVDSNLDWVGGLTQPSGSNYAVVVNNIFGTHSTSTVLLGTLSEIAGKNNIRGIVPVDADGDGTFESGVFVETAQLQADGYNRSYISAVDLTNMTIRWRKEVGFWTFTSPVAGDFDGGQRGEVLVGGWSGGALNTLYMFDALSGVLKMFYPVALRVSEMISAHSLAIDDIDGDGVLDLMLSGNKGSFYIFESGGRGSNIYMRHYRKDQNLNAVW